MLNLIKIQRFLAAGHIFGVVGSQSSQRSVGRSVGQWFWGLDRERGVKVQSQHSNICADRDREGQPGIELMTECGFVV